MSINEDIRQYMQSKDSEEKDLAKYIISEFQRVSKNKNRSIDDTTAISILKKLKRDYVDNTNFYGADELRKVYQFIDKFLPVEPTEDDIREYLNTIDFSKLKNKMQAIGLTNKYFSGNIDSQLVKEIIEKEY